MKKNHKELNSPVLKGQDAPAEVILVDPITLPIAYLLANLKVHPLLITLLAFIFRIGGGILFITNGLAIGAIFSIIGFYLDGIDGKIARIRHLDEELHGTIDFLLDQIAFAFMGIGALGWAIYNDHRLSALLIGVWLAFYMVLMAFTSTWLRILSQHGLVYKYGVGKDVFDEAVNVNNKIFINATLLTLKSFFISIRSKLARFRMIPYFGAIESEVVIFMIAPFFSFNPTLLLISIIFLIPDTLIIVTLSLLKVIKER